MTQYHHEKSVLHGWPCSDRGDTLYICKLQARCAMPEVKFRRWYILGCLSPYKSVPMSWKVQVVNCQPCWRCSMRSLKREVTKFCALSTKQQMACVLNCISLYASQLVYSFSIVSLCTQVLKFSTFLDCCTGAAKSFYGVTDYMDYPKMYEN